MIRFEEAIVKTIEILKKETSLAADMKGLILVRNATGAITVILPNNLLKKLEIDRLAEELDKSLGGYSPGMRRILLEQADLIDPEDILASPYLVQIPDEEIYLIDRMMTNQEWLREPIIDTLPLPTAAAFSIKGGVGRSTAFAAWAWGLARQGKRVLVVDLDLEAPGISSLLLDDLPQYGLVDWMMESLVQQADNALLDDMLGSSPLNQECAGIIQVIPAYGQKTRDYVAKLGRAYMPTMDDGGAFHGLAHRLEALLKIVALSLSPPDVVLLDARAGLHDIGSAVLSQLPTEIFLFARDERQTWEGYQHLFKHLQQSRSVIWGMPDQDLRWRLHMVAAQLGGAQNDFENAIRKSYNLWEILYDDASSQEANDHEMQPFQEFEDSAPHLPIPIYYEGLLAKKSLTDPQQRPAWEVVERAFGRFITEATERLFRFQESG